MTTMDRDDVVSTLNELIETCRDGQEGFRQAAEGASDPQLKSLCEEYSIQRQQFVRELQREVSRLGEEPAETGSVAGAMHRGWINIKAAVTGGDDKAIISECERGEDSALKTYREALAKGLPSDVRGPVERQCLMVQEAHDRVRRLELMAEQEESGTRTRHSRPL